MLKRFEPEEVVRVATDTLYIRKNAMHKLESVEAYVPPMSKEFTWEIESNEPAYKVEPAQWCDKGEWLFWPDRQDEYYPKYEHIKHAKSRRSAAPRYDDLLARRRLSYLNAGRGSGKTTRAIDLFRMRDPLVLTPTHRLAKEMRARGAKAQTYHGFGGAAKTTGHQNGWVRSLSHEPSFGTRSARCPGTFSRPFLTGLSAGVSRWSAAVIKASRRQS